MIRIPAIYLSYFYQKTSTQETCKSAILVRNKQGRIQRRYPAKGGGFPVHQSRACIMKIIEKCDTHKTQVCNTSTRRYRTSAAVELSKILVRSRCNTKSFTCWERNFFPRAKAMEEKKEASQQGQRKWHRPCGESRR
jgi:hypothetical protein